MDKLPTEILHRVFIELDLRERLICALVCRKWWNVLGRTCLCYNVTIHSCTLLFIKFMRMIKQSPHRAAQVQELDIYNSIVNCFNKRSLCIIFPNVRVLHVDNPKMNPYHLDHFIQQLDMTHLKSKVEELHDCDSCDLAIQLVNSNLCDRLHTLHLNFNNLYDESSNIIAIRNLEVAPLYFSHSELPESVIPAAKLIKFNYHAATGVNRNAFPNWYNYMSKKYANVVDFSYTDQSLSRSDFDTARQIYENGLLQLLQISGSSMRHRVLLSVPVGINVFEPLDNGNAKTESLALKYCQGGTLFQFLAQSNQSKHFKKPVIEEMEIGTPDSLRSLTSLIRLELNLVFIEARQIEIDFTSYLNVFRPSLQYFSARCSYIQFNQYTLSTNITTLHLHCIEIEKECGDILSNCFPNLEVLSLGANILEDINITIRNPNFKRTCFSKIRICYYEHVFSFKSANQADPLYYVSKLTRDVPTTREEMPNLPILTFVTFAEQNCKIDHHQAIQISSFGPDSQEEGYVF